MTATLRVCSPLGVVAALVFLFCPGCGAGEEAGSDPGSGGGPGGPGGAGNPLSVVLDFQVTNSATVQRTETILASVPFPEGGYQPADLANMIVSGHQTAWLPLQLWADGRVKVAQAQFTDTLAAGQTKTYVVARDEAAMSGAFVRNNWVAQRIGELQLGAEVRDTFQVAYRGIATGAGTVLQTSPLAQTTRWRTYHTPVGATGIGRDYLSSTFYVTEYRDMPFMVVDWVLGNDYLGVDAVPSGNTDPNLRPLGTVDVRAARFLCKGASAIMPYRPAQHAIGAAESMGNGFTGHRVMTDTWIGDAMTRRYRFLLRMEATGASPLELQRWQDTATAMLDQPIYALATPLAWQQTRAAGLLGGPIDGPADAETRARGEYESWAGQNHFGTWGSHGEVKVTATTGTPRNHPLSPELAHAIQGRSPRLLQKLEQMAWAQAMRPYHLWGLEVGAEQQIMLWEGTPLLLVQGQSLGRRALRDADPYPGYRTLAVGQSAGQGWNAYDHEHWSTDLLFDYWTISGDAWAKEELRQLGQSLKSLMRLSYYYTATIQAARAEGWCMQGFAQCYLATRDEALKQYAMRRATEVVEAQRKKSHPSRAMTFQANYPNTGYPANHQFFMPWQHGAVLYGYLGAYRAFQEPLLLDIAEDVVETIQYSWVTNVTSPQFGSVAQGLRYYVPVAHNGASVPANHWDNLSGGISFGDSPLGGAHTFLTGGLHQLAQISGDSSIRTRALLYGAALRGTLDANARWNKWNYCIPTVYAP